MFNVYFYNMSFILDILSAIAAILGVLFAFLAWMQSLKTRCYTSFETSFSNMIALQKSFFDNDFLRITKLNHTLVINKIAILFFSFRGRTHFYHIDTRLPVTINFSNFFTEIWNNFPNESFSHQDLVYIWNYYTERLVYQSHFLNSFKFLYNIIDTITIAKIKTEDKAKFVERVQALVNQDELFCYYMNQIVYSNENDSPYLKILRAYDFFKDVLSADKFSGIMTNINLSDKSLLRNSNK